MLLKSTTFKLKKELKPLTKTCGANIKKSAIAAFIIQLLVLLNKE